MKIAIYHNLKKGGGFQYITSLIKELSILNITIDVYTHQNTLIPNANKTYFYPLKITNNIFNHVKQVLIETEEKEKEMSAKIIQNNYDYIFIFPCHLQQCPNIINFLPKQITYYFYLESLREFYENTTFDYYRLNKILSRIIRYPIKLQDHFNCSNVTNIVSDSYYSNYQLKKIYNKKSNIIYPGMVSCTPRKIIIKNNHKSVSFGLLSMLKGHHITSQINPKIKIFGSPSHDNIDKYLSKEIYINKSPITDFIKSKIYKSYSIFFANQINEPFGITTLEATNQNCFILGRNEAGTCEIINNGSNGFLYNINNIELSKKVFRYFQKKDKIIIRKTIQISWKETVNKILNIVTHV